MEIAVGTDGIAHAHGNRCANALRNHINQAGNTVYYLLSGHVVFGIARQLGNQHHHHGEQAHFEEER